MKYRENAKIIRAGNILGDIYEMWLEAADIAREAKSGQFISLYCKDGSRILPRPISVCETEGNTLRIVYRVVGNGTREFSTMKPGEHIDIIGPLGNGFDISRKSALLIAGGIGIPPMVQLAKELSNFGNFCIDIVLGYRDAGLFLTKELERYGRVYIATEDGSVGTRGNVMDSIREHDIHADMIYSCGPLPMLKAVKAYAEENGITSQISMEERMACGIGACLACVCRSTQEDHHSRVHNMRVCKDGPVFYSKEVEL